MSRIILPVILGIGVVFYLLWKQFDPQEYSRINWSERTFFWIGMAFLFVIIRHLSYSARIHILSEKKFSWKKSIELIFIWEFSSAVSPTSVGGSAVAFFVLAQEKLPTAKTATIVLYTVVLDTLFYISTLLILFLIFGSSMIRPDMNSFYSIDGWGYTFFIAYAVMLIYGSIFYYGLFVNPNQIKRLLVGFTKIKFLKKYRRNAVKLGNEMIIASQEMKKQNWKYHLGGFITTAMAWSSRFLHLNCLIIAFIPLIPLDFWTQFALFSRLETMFAIIAFSPTPGGAGFVEILFSGFLTDYVESETYSLVISFTWRLLTYYIYLFAGVIIIPNWIRKIINERQRRHAQQEKEAALAKEDPQA